MNKKSLVAVILLLSFVIAVLLFNQKEQRHKAIVELENKFQQVEKELKQSEK